jgi:glycosyltransferase involved in cell wall biosynthesis
MSRLIVDITELATWQGKLTGVPRVMDELARRFAGENAHTDFVIWSGYHRAFQKIDYSIEGRKQASQKEVEESKRPSHRYAGIVNRAKNLKESSRLASKALAVPERVARKLLQPKLFAEPQETIEPTSNDKLLVLADWHGSDTAFIEKLKELHSKQVDIIQVSYDMLPIVTPQYSGHATKSFTKYVNEIYPICKKIIAISEHTKKDIGVYLKSKDLPVPPVEVIRLGDDFAFAEAIKPTDPVFVQKYSDDKNFLLCVGTIEARKNHTLLYYTYRLAAQHGITVPNIVVVGRRGWLSDDIYEIINNDPLTKDKFVFLMNVPDEQLSWLYEHCLFTIYPSFYEGWGLPVAESVARKVPCVASNTSSIPEIAGTLISYFDPFSTDECLEAITNMLSNNTLKRAREKLTKYQHTTWDKTFTQVCDIIEVSHG